MKRILFLTESLVQGGAERAAINLMHLLANEGHLVSVLVCGGPAEWDAQLPAAIRKHYASSVARQPFRKTVLASARQLLRLGKSHDIAIALHPNTSGLLYLTRWCLKSLRTIGWIHFNAADYLPAASLPVRFSIRHAYVTMDACVFVSASSMTSMTELPRIGSRIRAMAGVIANVLTTNSTGTPSQNLGQIQQCRQAGMAIVLHVGRLSAEKQPLHAVQVSRLLEASGIRHKLFILGDGPQFLQVSMAATNAHSVVVGGSENHVQECLKQASALILTPRFDNWPTIALEAMACGTPVLAYNAPGGLSTILDHGLRGHLTAPTPEAMAEALATVLADPEKEGERIANGHAFMAGYNSGQILVQWQKLFDNLAVSP